MTTRYRTECVVLDKKDQHESDRVFSVFTKDFGKIDVLAKAVRKINSKLKAGIDVFYLSEIEFIQGKNRKTLTDAVVIKKNRFIREDENYKIVKNIFDLLEGFVKGQERDEQTFELLMQSLSGVEGGWKEKELAYYYFLWNFLSLQGYHFETKKCVSCKNDLEPECIFISCKNGGTVCKKCAPDQGLSCKKVDKDLIKVLRLILEKNWPIVLKLKTEESLRKALFEISQTAVKTFVPS